MNKNKLLKFYNIYMYNLFKIHSIILLLQGKLILNISFSLVLMFIYSMTKTNFFLKKNLILENLSTEQNFLFKEELTSWFWLNIILSLILFIENILYTDYKNGNLDLYFITNLSLEIILFLKLLINTLIFCIFIFFIIKLFYIFFNFSLQLYEYIYIYITLFSLNAITMILTAFILEIKQRIFLLYLLTFPLFIPFIIFYNFLTLYKIIFILSFILLIISPLLTSLIIKKNL